MYTRKKSTIRQIYPHDFFIHIPIINSKNKEIVLFYIPDYEIDNFRRIVNPEGLSEILENSKVTKNMIKFFKILLDKNFRYGIESRLDYAYKNMVRN